MPIIIVSVTEKIQIKISCSNMSVMLYRVPRFFVFCFVHFNVPVASAGLEPTPDTAVR